MNGKGEITDVSLNCSLLNDVISKITPFVELESVRISKLSFNVTSWTNLKKAPLCVVIEDVHAVIVEPLHYIPREQRRTLKIVSKNEYDEMNKGKKPRGSYFLIDRIIDNLQIEIRSVNVSLQPRGKFKTRHAGPWTPPALHMVMRHVCYQSVNEYGNPASPDECWRHNTFAGRPHEQTLRIHKKMSMGSEIGLETIDGVQTTLVREAKVEIQIMFHKRVRDAAMLGVQVDATLNLVEVHVCAGDISTLAHAAAGFQYCFAKDREFEDPLVGTKRNSEDALGEAVEVRFLGSAGTASVKKSAIVVTDVNEEDDGDYDESDEDSRPPEHDTVAFDDDGMPRSEVKEDESSVGAPTEVSAKSETDLTAASSSAQSEKSAQTKSFVPGGRPVIITPTGIVIHERLSVSVSVNHCTVRGVYAANSAPENSHIQMAVKGVIAEMIWPKTTGEKGVYIQMSVAYMSLQEKYEQRIRFLMIGGIQHDVQGRPVERPSPGVAEIPKDENFPLFEDRCMQPDPFRLRDTFPAQAIGIKATVHFVDKIARPDEEETMVVNDIGVDQFEITMDTESWSRAVRFAMNEEGGGFDPRWDSGDWSDILTTDMLVRPFEPLNLANHVQATSKVFLDENSMISSDLFNLTSRIRNVVIRVPAAISKDVRSCDLVMNLGELMLVISSALPRTFLTGKIGSSITGDDGSASAIDFPNDPSDICYDIEKTEDPRIRQEGTMTSRTVSTFRSQLTIRELSLNLVPVIRFCNHSKPQQLLAPLELTLLACFEGEPPTIANNNLMKLALFLSIQIHRVAVSCDFDLMSGAISTGLHHAEILTTTVASMTKLLADMEAKAPKAGFNLSYSEIHGDTKINATTSRRVLTSMQFENSRAAGGLTLSVCFQLADLSVSIWRQNVPVNSHFRASFTQDYSFSMEDTIIPLVQVLKIHLGAIELGAEAHVQNKDRRVILKCCLSSMEIHVCDFEEKRRLYTIRRKEEQERAAELQRINEIFTVKEEVGDDEEVEREKRMPLEPEIQPSMVELLAFGGQVSLNEPTSGDISVRVEERLEASRTITMSMDVGSGGVMNLHAHKVEMLLLLLIEALLLPTGTIHHFATKRLAAVYGKAMSFPSGSIGALFASLADIPNETNQVDYPVNIMEQPLFEHVDKQMEAFITSKLPANTSTLLLRINISNLLVFIPQKPGDEQGGVAPWFGLFLREATFLSGYFTQVNDKELKKNPILSVLSHRGSSWDDIFFDKRPGFQHRISTAQSLHVGEPTTSVGEMTDTLIPLFSVHGMYSQSKLDLSLGDSTFSVIDLGIIKNFYDAILVFVQRTISTQGRIESVLVALKGGDFAREEPSETTRFCYPTSTSQCLVVESSLGATKAYLQRLSSLVASHDLSTRFAISKQQKRVEELEFQVFFKERARLGALALLASQAAGWLRMGGTHIHGQRAPRVANMWTYYVVLRKSLLLFYETPGKSTPLDIVCLQGARLHVLAGGRRKSDIKHGFAIIEKTGKARLFVALTGPEYESWTKELQATATFYSSQINDVGHDDGSLLEQFPQGNVDASSNFLDTQGEATNMLIRMRLRTSSSDADLASRAEFDRTTSRRGEKVRATFSNITAAVARANRNRSKSDHDSGNEQGESVEVMCVDNLGHDELVLNSSGQTAEDIISQRQAANKGEYGADDGEGTTGQPKSVQHNIDTEDNTSTPLRGRQLGNRLASLRSTAKNRVGGAMQAAMEKTKTVAEQRKLRKHSEELNMEQNQSEGESSTRLGAFKNRLGGVSSSLKKRLEKSETSPAPAIAPASVQASDSSLEGSPNFNSFPLEASHSWETEPVASEVSLPAYKSDLAEDLNNGGEAKSDNHDYPPLSLVETLVGEKVDEKSGEVLGKVARGRDEDDEQMTESSAPRQFGARVKNLSTSIREMRASSPKLEEGKGRFSVRARFATPKPSESFDVTVEGTTLRGIRVGDGHPADNFGEPLIPIESVVVEKFSGDYTVYVASHIFQPGDDVPNVRQKVSGREEENICDGALEFPLLDEVTFSQQTPPFEAIDTKVKFTSPQIGFKINLISRNFQMNGETKTSRKVATTLCTFADVLSLYTAISESVASIKPLTMPKSLNEIRDAASDMKQDLANVLGLSTLDCVKLTGTLLGGLIGASTNFETVSAFREYECEILTEFLNSVLNCPLPVDALRTMATFLNIDNSHEYTKVETSDNSNGAASETFQTATSLIETSSTAEKILALTSAVQTELLRAEADGIFVQRVAPSLSPKEKTIRQLSTRSSSLPYLEPLLPSAISDSLRDSLHNALMAVMAERDEARARLIAASVLHAHEVEQERKQIFLLGTKLKIAQALAENPVQDGFVNPFQNNNAAREQARRESEENLKLLTDSIAKNTDAEMVSLCQQLSREIESKTEKALEVVRLQECHKLERETDLAEKQALQAELKRVKEEVGYKQAKLKEIQQEAEAWKEAYEELQGLAQLKRN